MDVLKDNGIKVTRQRQELIDLYKNNNALTMKDFKDSLKDMNESTIYRILNHLVSKNVLIKDIRHDGEVVYILKGQHKHYLKCVKCKRVIELKRCPFEEKDTIGGFKVLDHYINIDGICPKCQKEN